MNNRLIGLDRESIAGIGIFLRKGHTSNAFLRLRPPEADIALLVGIASAPVAILRKERRPFPIPWAGIIKASQRERSIAVRPDSGPGSYLSLSPSLLLA